MHRTFVSDILLTSPFLILMDLSLHVNPSSPDVAGNFNKHLHGNAYSNGLIPSIAALSFHVYSATATHEQKYAGGIISRTAPADAVIMT